MPSRTGRCTPSQETSSQARGHLIFLPRRQYAEPVGGSGVSPSGLGRPHPHVWDSPLASPTRSLRRPRSASESDRAAAPVGGSGGLASRPVGLWPSAPDASACSPGHGLAARWWQVSPEKRGLEGDAQAEEALGHPALEGLKPGDGRRQLSLNGRQPILNPVLDLGPFGDARRGPARVCAGRSVLPLAGGDGSLLQVCGTRPRGLVCRRRCVGGRCCASSPGGCVRPCFSPGRARRMRCRVRVDDAARKPPSLSRDKAVLPRPLAHVRRSRCRHALFVTRREAGEGASRTAYRRSGRLTSSIWCRSVGARPVQLQPAAGPTQPPPPLRAPD